MFLLLILYKYQLIKNKVEVMLSMKFIALLSMKFIAYENNENPRKKATKNLK